MALPTYQQIAYFLKKKEDRIFHSNIKYLCLLESGGSGRNNKNIPIRLFFDNGRKQDVIVRYNLNLNNTNKIKYEYRKLKFLAGKFSPRPYYFSDKKDNSLKKDILVMEYLDGPLIKPRFLSRSDLKILAKILISIHEITFNKISRGLEFPPLHQGCSGDIILRMINELNNFFINTKTQYRDQIFCIFNQIKTNLILRVSKIKAGDNSFIHGDLRNHFIKRDSNFYLLDWELSRVGDSAYDLAHFLYFSKLSKEFKSYFINQYYKGITRNSRDDVRQRVKIYLILEEFLGLKWCWEQMNFRKDKNEKYYYNNLYQLRFKNLIKAVDLFDYNDYILTAEHLGFI